MSNNTLLVVVIVAGMILAGMAIGALIVSHDSKNMAKDVEKTLLSVVNNASGVKGPPGDKGPPGNTGPTGPGGSVIQFIQARDVLVSDIWYRINITNEAGAGNMSWVDSNGSVRKFYVSGYISNQFISDYSSIQFIFDIEQTRGTTATRLLSWNITFQNVVSGNKQQFFTLKIIQTTISDKCTYTCVANFSPRHESHVIVKDTNLNMDGSLNAHNMFLHLLNAPNVNILTKSVRVENHTLLS